MIDEMLEYAGAAKRGGDLFGNKNMASRMFKSVKRGLKGVDNVYTQHEPLLAETLDLLIKGKLKDTSHPFTTMSNAREKPQDVIVFIIGGATFEEAAKVAEINASGAARVVLGSTFIHNSDSFLREVSDMQR